MIYDINKGNGVRFVVCDIPNYFDNVLHYH